MQLDSRTLALLLVVTLGSVLTAEQTTTPSQAAGDNDGSVSPQPSSLSDNSSQARIVRLSEITGEVEVDRNTGEGFEPALLNLPIVEGSNLRTAAGFAEVEFEDDSTLRLTPFTAVKFEQLRLQSSGSTVSAVHVQTGTVYVSLACTKGNEFTLSFAGQNVLLMPSSHVRLFLKGQWVSLSVLHGKATVEASTGNTTISNRTMNFHLQEPVEVSQNKNAAAPYDGWDEDAIEYHDHNAKKNRYGNPGGRGRHCGHELLRAICESGRLRHDVAAILRRCSLGSVCQWSLGLISGLGLRVGLPVPMGVDRVPLRWLELLSRCRLGMATVWAAVPNSAHSCEPSSWVPYSEAPAATASTRVRSCHREALARRCIGGLADTTRRPPGFCRAGRSSRELLIEGRLGTRPATGIDKNRCPVDADDCVDWTWFIRFGSRSSQSSRQNGKFIGRTFGLLRQAWKLLGRTLELRLFRRAFQRRFFRRPLGRGIFRRWLFGRRTQLRRRRS